MREASPERFPDLGGLVVILLGQSLSEKIRDVCPASYRSLEPGEDQLMINCR